MTSAWRCGVRHCRPSHPRLDLARPDAGGTGLLRPSQPDLLSRRRRRLGRRWLSALLHVFDRHGVPLDLAVIPAALSESLAAHLRAGPRTGPHGYTSTATPTSTTSRPDARTSSGPRGRHPQQSDIARGRSLLQEAFDAALDPVFTPPWNRCTRGTADTLVALGFEVLSRDHTATGFDRPDLVAGHEQARATTILRLSRGTRPASVRGGVPASPEADRDL